MFSAIGDVLGFDGEFGYDGINGPTGEGRHLSLAGLGGAVGDFVGLDGQFGQQGMAGRNLSVAGLGDAIENVIAPQPAAATTAEPMIAGRWADSAGSAEGGRFMRLGDAADGTLMNVQDGNPNWPFGRYDGEFRDFDSMGQHPLDYASRAGGELFAGFLDGAWGGEGPAIGRGAAVVAGEVRALQSASQVRRLIGGSVDDFMASNAERLGQKLGEKLGQGRLPFEISREGFQQALDVVAQTLRTPSRVSAPFRTSGGNVAVDVYSQTTTMTVRVRVNGTFDTLIANATRRP